jgi:hypothetical protein
MRWLRLLFVAVLVIVAAWPVSVTAAAASTGDFVSGGGTTASFGGTIPLTIPFRLQNIVIDAHSDPTGADAGGTVSFEVAVASPPFSVIATPGGPVTCLAVRGNDALIGFNDVTSFFG